jgi:hypothetical protein
VETHQRHSAQSQRRISWTEETHRRPGALSRNNPSWLNAHSSSTNARSWHRVHRDVHAHRRHTAKNRITWCLTSHSLPRVSTGRLAQVYNLTPAITPYAPPGCLSCMLRRANSSYLRRSAFVASLSCLGRRYSPACAQGPLPNQKNKKENQQNV